MKQKNRLNYVVFIAPTMVLFLLVFAVPVVVLVGSSFCNWRTGDPITFNGIGNYIELIFHDNSFRQGFLNNVVWILLQGTIHVAIGVLFALILARRPFYWKFARTAYMIPSIISSAAMGMLFLCIFNPEFGMINSIVRMFLPDYDHNWFMSYDTAFLTVTLTWMPYAAITTLLAGVVAGAVASMVFPVNPYHLIEVTEPVFAFFVQMKYFLILAVIVSVCGKFYSSTVNAFRHVYAKVSSPAYVKMFYLVLVAYIISLMQVNLTGGGEQFLLAQAQNGSTQIMWVTAVMLLHFVFSVFSVSSGLPGGSFIPTLVTGGLLGQIVGLVGVRYGVIGQENVSYIMLVSMSAFLVAVVRTPLTAIVLITEITGHFEVFYPSVVVGGLTYYFTELLQMKPSNVSLYEDMIHAPDFKEEKRYTLSVEIMTDSYLDGKLVDELSLPERCVIINVHRDGKNLVPAGTRLIPGDQVQIEMDSQDIEKLYEPLVSMANIY